jgi:hypothetical protein
MAVDSLHCSLAIALTGRLPTGAFRRRPRQWQHRFHLRHGRGIDGDAQIDPSRSGSTRACHVFDALEFGAMAAYRADNGTWSFTADATFMGLGAHDTHETRSDARVKGEIDVDQTTLMGTLGRRWTEHLEFLFGLAYVDLSMDLSLQSRSGGPLDVKASRDGGLDRLTVGLGTTGRSAATGASTCAATSAASAGPTSCTTCWPALLASIGDVGVFLGYRLISATTEEGNKPELSALRPDRAGPMLGMSVSF